MPPLPPGTAAVRGAVRSALTQQIDAGALAAGDLVLVGCSGGADSLALAAGTAFVAPRLGLRAGAVSVDHQMQSGSAQVSATTIDRCAALGLDPALVRTAEPPRSAGLGPEATARTLRYDQFARAARDTGARAVLLGHTLDDQAETVLLALARGSGTRSVAGMSPVRGIYLRPLLGVGRAQTEAACAEAGLPVWQDPANAAAGPWRTASGAPLPRAAVREQVLPALTGALGPEVIGALGRTADLARADADLLDELAAQWHDRARRAATPVRSDRPGAAAAGRSAVVVLSVTELAESPTALRTRVLRRAALEAGSPGGALSATHVQAMEDLVVRWHGQGPIHLPGGVRAERRYGNLVLGVPAQPPEPSAPDRSGPAADHTPQTQPGEARGRQHDG